MIRKQPALFVLVWVVVGIVVADQLRLPSWLPLLLASFCIVFGLYSVYRAWATAGALLLTVGLGLLAAFHFSLDHIDVGPHHIENFARQNRVFRIYGQVADWPDLRKNRTEIKLTVDSLRAERSYLTQGEVLLKISDTTTALQRGDRIEFTGRIYPLPAPKNSASFDYGRFLNLKGVQGIVYLNTLLNVRIDRRPGVGFMSLVDNLRGAVSSSFERNLSPTAAALAGGFLIGETRDIPVEVYEMFRDSGTLHLLAVSGSNVALVLAFFLVLMRPFRFRPPGRAVLLLSVIVLFAGLSYAEPSVMRASLMASLVILAGLMRRIYDLNNIIALTALIILLIDPAQLFDVGFQLSFVTAWGLILLVPKICAPLRAYHGRWWYRAIVFPLIVAVVAQVCSTPVVAYYFGRIPVISVFANLVIVVMVSVGVVGILVLLVLDLIWPLLGLMVGSLVNIWLNLVVTVLVWMGGENIPVILTWSLLEGPAGPWWVLSLYALIVLGGFAVSHKKARRAALVLLLLVCNLALAGAALSDDRDDSLEVRFTSVPGGLAATVRNPSTDRVDLVITGLRDKPYPIDERILQPWLERRGVGVINRMFVLTADYDTIDDLLRLAERAGCRRLLINSGLNPSFRDQLRLADGIEGDLEIVCLRGIEPATDTVGYVQQHGGLCLQTPTSRLVFVARLREEHLALAGPAAETWLAVGQKWTGSANDWVRLHRRGFSRIICSEFEQASPAAYFDPALEPDSDPPDYCHDLSTEGNLLLRLPISSE